MRQLRSCLFILFAVLATTLSRAQTALATPIDVTYCELASNPAKFNHKVIRIEGLVSHGFEDFQLSDPTCPKFGFSIWLTYGADVQSGTIYCCPGEGASEKRSESLQIESIPLTLRKDDRFSAFDALLKQSPETTAKATVVGHFFAGTETQIAGPKTPPLPPGVKVTEPTMWRGFGHMGCCSLLAIEAVENVEPHNRADLDYSADGGWDDNTGMPSCGGNSVRWKTVSFNGWRALGELRDAETGTRAWAYEDPARIAIEAISNLENTPEESIKVDVLRTGLARIVYRWKKSADDFKTVIVTRPYWLSTYSQNGKVPWVATSIKSPFSCD